MARKVAGSAEAAEEKPAEPVQRLCNEIQLFDLCELEKCGHKQGPFCTSPDLLGRFEAIAEDVERPAASRYMREEGDDASDDDDDGYGDGYDDGRFDVDDYDRYDEDE